MAVSSSNCIFCKIIKGEIPSTKVFETDSIFAFRDVNPCAPQHILLVPKMHREDLNNFDDSHKNILGELLLAAKNVAKQEGLDAYRTVINTGAEAGQTVFHLHLHLIAGRKLNWPPG